MVVGIERLRQAARLLSNGSETRPNLLAAASEYWSATIDAPTWPVELQARCDDLNRRLLLYGRIRDTIEHMTDRELRRVREELLGVIGFAERLDSAAGDG